MKTYIKPELEATEVQATNMVALSIQSGKADPDKEVLTKETGDNWEIW